MSKNQETRAQEGFLQDHSPELGRFSRCPSLMLWLPWIRIWGLLDAESRPWAPSIPTPLLLSQGLETIPLKPPSGLQMAHRAGNASVCPCSLRTTNHGHYCPSKCVTSRSPLNNQMAKVTDLNSTPESHVSSINFVVAVKKSWVDPIRPTRSELAFCCLKVPFPYILSGAADRK